MTDLIAEYNALVKDVTVTEKLLNKLETELSAKRVALRKLVTVNKKYSSFTQLEFEGRKIRAKYNSYGDCTVTENGKELPLTFLRGSRPSISDLRLYIATGRI